MINLFEYEDYSELILSLQEIAMQYQKNNQQEDPELNTVIDTIEKSLHDFSQFKQAIDQSIIIAVTDVKGKILYVNNKFCEISQYSSEELVGKTHRIINAGYHDKLFFNDMWNTINRGEIWEGNIKNKAKDGSFYWVKSTVIPFCHEDKQPYMFIALRTDITKGKESEEKLVQALKNDFNVVVSSMNCFVFYVSKDESGQFVYLLGEGRLSHEFGLTTTQIYNKTPREVYVDKIADILEEKYEKAYSGEIVTYDYSYNGHHVFTTLSPVYENGKIIKLIGCTNDISELNRAKEKVEFLAYHDILTGLPNRGKFTEDITQLLKAGRRFALFTMDLDRFKFINDMLGHTYGDELLKAVSGRLQSAAGQNGYIYRFAGDEFVMLLPEGDERTSYIKYANKLLAVFKEKIQLSDRIELYTTGSIGISVFPEQGEDADTLLKNADSAMYAAKKLGKNNYKVYNQTMKQASQKNIQIETFLRAAIINEELQLFFQPKLNLQDNKIVSMEALLRWHHPILGNMPPDIFIPLAEETGIIWEIDEWVLRNACRQNKEWNESGMFGPLRIAVNISANHFSRPNFVRVVERILRETGLSPELLELEITETAIIDNTDECLNNMKRLNKLGVIVSIDDFGTGYTSLNYLKKFSFRYLKIDRTYIKEMDKNKEDRAIVKMIISLAHELQLKVVAEGVEDSQIVDCLHQFGCDEIQGYFVSRPLPKSEFEEFIEGQYELVNNNR